MGRSEAEAIAEVTRQLVQRFPDIPEDRVFLVVAQERERLADGRIREFLPLLAERAAMQHLKAEQLGLAT